MTAVFEQGGADDSTILSEGIVENQFDLEEAITIKRFASQSATPNALGQAAAPSYTSFPATAVLLDLGIDASHLAADVLSAGAIKLQIRERLRESDEAAAGSNPGDRVIFRGAEYRLIQRGKPVTVGGNVVFYEYLLRRINANGDTAGL